MRHELNIEVAQKLGQMADLLEVQGEGGFRVGAYRRAADTVRSLERPVSEILTEEGKQGLVALPTIGEGIAAAIAEMTTTGRWSQLDRLTGSLDPALLFQSVPGIGPKLALRIHDDLDIDTLEQLEMAAHDGRLERVPGVGARRASAIRTLLKERLARRIRGASHTSAPPVDVVLAVDESYRRKAAAGALRRIAPRRFNPSGEAWLPVMHETHGPWHFTALFSNTPTAHQLGKTGDWVVLYFHTEGAPEAQCTVVTEAQGVLRGKRVVRGRERECAAHYAAQTTIADAVDSADASAES
jgi:hypothetical protein